MQAMANPRPAVTAQDHDVDGPTGLESRSLDLEDGLLNTDLTDDTIAIHCNPDRYVVALLMSERVIDELPVPARHRLVSRTWSIRVFDESCDRRLVGARGLSHDDGYRDHLQRTSRRFNAEAWIIQRYAPLAFRWNTSGPSFGFTATRPRTKSPPAGSAGDGSIPNTRS